MTPEARTITTEDEYIALERTSATKSELINGEVVAMAGASPRHNALCAAFARVLGNALEKKPRVVLTSDQRVHVEATGLYTYPDLTVTCDRPQFPPHFRDTLVNPQVIVEVLSESTEAYDRGAKFAHYRSIPSLREYVLVSQDQMRVEHYERLASGQWVLTVSDGEGGVVRLPSLECEIALADVYAKVSLLESSNPAAESS